MNHQDAIQESSAERYILGELSGETRDRFEEHLFECQECADDLKAGVMFLEVSRDELPAIIHSRSERKPWYAWLLSPALLAPALAACLVVISYDTAVVVPRAKHDLAQANAPSIVNSVTLAAGTARSEDVHQVSAPEGGSFLISFDIPPQSNDQGYLCSLYSPSGALVWHGAVTAEQAKNTITIRVPAASTQAGLNRLTVEPAGAPGGKSGEPARYQFLLSIEK